MDRGELTLEDQQDLLAGRLARFAAQVANAQQGLERGYARLQEVYVNEPPSQFGEYQRAQLRHLLAMLAAHGTDFIDGLAGYAATKQEQGHLERRIREARNRDSAPAAQAQS